MFVAGVMAWFSWVIEAWQSGVHVIALSLPRCAHTLAGKRATNKQPAHDDNAERRNEEAMIEAAALAETRAKADRAQLHTRRTTYRGFVMPCIHRHKG
jgi:hypothetical protein